MVRQPSECVTVTYGDIRSKEEYFSHFLYKEHKLSIKYLLYNFMCIVKKNYLCLCVYSHPNITIHVIR